MPLAFTTLERQTVLSFPLVVIKIPHWWQFHPCVVQHRTVPFQHWDRCKWENELYKVARLSHNWTPFFGKKKYQNESKRQYYRAIVEPITTYRAENCQLTSRTKKKLEVDFLRRASRIFWLGHIRKEVIKEKTKVEEDIVDQTE